MGYGTQLWLEKDQEIDVLAEAHNNIPLFWSLIFSNNQYTIIVSDDEYEGDGPLLKIEPPNLVIPNTHFNDDILNCWQDFTEMLKQKITQNYTLVLDLASILLMDEDEESLKTVADINTACQKTFEEIIQYYTTSKKSLTYSHLVGNCYSPEIDVKKYPSLYSKIASENRSQAKKTPPPSFKGAVFLILKESFTILFCIALCLYSLYLIIVDSQWILGTLGVLLFGLGTFIYTMMTYEKIQDYIARIKKNEST